MLHAPAQLGVPSIPEKPAWEDINQIWALWLPYFYAQIKMLLELPLYPCCQLRSLPKCTVWMKGLVLGQEWLELSFL